MLNLALCTLWNTGFIIYGFMVHRKIIHQIYRLHLRARYPWRKIKRSNHRMKIKYQRSTIVRISCRTLWTDNMAHWFNTIIWILCKILVAYLIRNHVSTSTTKKSETWYCALLGRKNNQFRVVSQKIVLNINARHLNSFFLVWLFSCFLKRV